MKESIANAFIVNMVIVFFIIFIFFFAGSLTYSKAFKVKNRIVDIIEKYEEFNTDAQDEIGKALKEMGYRVNVTNKECPKRPNDSTGQVAETMSSNDYRYCVYKYTTTKGEYYGVAAYMYFDIPIIGQSLEFPVYGETKIMGIIR